MSSAAIVTVAVDPAEQSVTVNAVAVGSATVHISDEAGGTADIPVQVLPVSGVVPNAVQLTLTGDPATPEFIRAEIDAAVLQAIAPTLTAGSSAHTVAVWPDPQLLASGFLTDFSVSVRIDPAAGSLAVAATTTVNVINAGLPPISPSALSFRDDPERIGTDGVLSRTTIGLSTPTRLYYYHQNIHESRRFAVVLTANDSVVTHVQLVGAAAGPNIDVMSVGHAVSKTFLAREPRNEGTVVEIRGGIPLVQREITVSPGEGIVGALDLRVLDGGPVTATVMAIPPSRQLAAYIYAPKLPDDGHTRHGNFNIAGFGQRIIAYTSGGRDATYTYGNRQNTLENMDPADAGRDFGDYGVLQRLTFDVSNPADTAATAYLYEKPLGGVVRSSFAVNGTVMDVGCARLAQHYLIDSFLLAPRAVETIDVMTMTDGGSNYPLEIGLTATLPGTTPPIFSHDGCFPKPTKATVP